MTLDDSLIMAAFGAMGTVITVMWQKLSAENKRLNDRSDKCEADREKLFAAVAELRGDSVLLERCPAQRCPLRPARASMPPGPLPHSNPHPLPRPL